MNQRDRVGSIVYLQCLLRWPLPRACFTCHLPVPIRLGMGWRRSSTAWTGDIGLRRVSIGGDPARFVAGYGAGQPDRR